MQHPRHQRAEKCGGRASEREALFTSLCDAIPDNIYFKDRQSRFVRINGAMARQFGFGRATEVAERPTSTSSAVSMPGRPMPMSKGSWKPVSR